MKIVNIVLTLLIFIFDKYREVILFEGKGIMAEKINIVYQDGTGEIVEKKSRFIGHVHASETEEGAVEFIDRIKKEHWNAAHNCFAYVVGDKSQIQRCSDDGEPSGTAGRPILDIILGEDIRNVVIVVTRYFGGTLLGTGGLVRAYQKGAKAGLENSIIIQKKPGCKVFIKTDYNGIGKLQYITGQLGLLEVETIYTDIVEVHLITPEHLYDLFVTKVTEATSGRAVIKNLGEVFYGELDGECIVFK